MRKRFFIQILITIVAALVFSSLYFYTVCGSLLRAGEGTPAKLNHILYDTTHYDALFTGSSRVSRCIDPLLFERLTGMRSYNAGIDGANFTLIDLLIRKFIKSHGAPQNIFINMDVYTMEHDSSFFSYPQFFPYMHDPDLRSMKTHEPVLAWDKYPFLAVSYFNDYLREVSFHTLVHVYRTPDPLIYRKGFAPIQQMTYHGTDNASPLIFVYDAMQLKKLDALCAFCAQMHCHIFFVMAPIYRAHDAKSGNGEAFYPLLRDIEKRHGVKELNFYTDQRFTKELFFNATHLNNKGAALYTRILSDSVNTVSQRPSPTHQET